MNVDAAMAELASLTGDWGNLSSYDLMRMEFLVDFIKETVFPKEK